MAWWQWYVALSFCISLFLTICETIHFYRKPNKSERVGWDIDEAIESGHIQREVFGERTVLHPKDDEGRLLLEATDFGNDLRQKQKILCFVMAVLCYIVTWPYELYDYVRYRFSSAD